MKSKDIIDLFGRMYSEHWAYELGAAREGCVDCSGAFVYAFKKLGGSAIEHGSNAIARKRVGAMMPVDCARPGWAAFKWKAAGEPEKYTDGKGNYFHIGLVDGTGRYVLNAKGAESGFSRDALSGWSFAAPLTAVDYGEEETAMEVIYQAAVNTMSTGLNLRDAPGGSRIGSLPYGATVDVLDDSNAGWWRVRYDGQEGYASTAYLVRVVYADAVTAVPDAVSTAKGVTTLVRDDGTCIVLIGKWRVVED